MTSYVKGPIAKLIANNEIFDYWFSKLSGRKDCNSQLLEKLINFIEQYILFYKFSSEYIDKVYSDFLSQYIADIELFMKTNEYPSRNNKKIVYKMPRTTYDLVLMLSVILTFHRYKIMDCIYTMSSPVSNALVVGLGSGMEADLIKPNTKKIIAYDLSISDFCRKVLKYIDSRQDHFNGNDGQVFQRIYLIEILEHLYEPYLLLAKCVSVLKPGGQIFLTTATNIPQFDHLYNFDNLDLFEEKVKKLGLVIMFKEDIMHDTSFNINAKNTFYILQLN